ncbi:hypothetical protein [Marinomonas posidonica]|uniref:hypothetical protein n=1 Tax=Marinomonas posidonica TaxID=936476 RepID=UPI0037356038
MKNLNKTILALVTASVFSTAAMASSDDSVSDRLMSARGSVEALATTLENMGANVDASVDLNGAYTPAQKTAVYVQKHDELQAQFDALHAE